VMGGEAMIRIFSNDRLSKAVTVLLRSSCALYSGYPIIEGRMKCIQIDPDVPAL
jgi:hypothetical protein